MLMLENDSLRFCFPQVHAEASCRVTFERTLRIPDDNGEYPLPPSLGRFPMRLVDEYADQVPDDWQAHGGVLLPMYQSEALWIDLHGGYPCAVKVATGKVNAITGAPWQLGLNSDPQDYVVIPIQPWLDGFCVSEGLIRQFVAMPLGEGYTAEEQITDSAEHGGLQLAVYPMKAEVYKEILRERERERQREARLRLEEGGLEYQDIPVFSRSPSPRSMGMAAGGLMHQTIHKDTYGQEVWDQTQPIRCFVHLLNSQQYQTVTGERPPKPPFDARDYAKAGLPWFHHYSNEPGLAGSGVLAKLRGLATMTVAKAGKPMAGNKPLGPLPVKTLGKKVIRDGEF
ncbi:hypothetical protein [Thiohalocapsa marina]|uniref:hypothetical protein n=1 Tax=Thiohalocapsa marina TaxID=424902 RepID=UPI0036D82B00